MTREEAIDCINAIHVQMFNSGNSKWTEACDMAIEALKEQDKREKEKPKKCPNCNSDLYEYCFMCCYEGEKL